MEELHKATENHTARAAIAVPAVRVNQRTILVSPDAALSAPPVALGLYARVSSHDQRCDLDRQVAGLQQDMGEVKGALHAIETRVALLERAPA